MIRRRLARDPGPKIKGQLRREVNFGCPVRYVNGSGCGSPILTFHHFDPPWAGNHVHDPAGMIALCPEHHYQADGGLWTNDQLRAFKKSPFVDDAIRVQWPWLPERLVMKVGRSLVVASGSPARINERPLMHFRPVKIDTLGIQAVEFDSDIRTRNDTPWMRIDRSWFDLRLAGTTDLVFTAQTKTFEAKHRDDLFLRMRFRKMVFDRFEKWVPKFMSNEEIAKSAVQSAVRTGAVDADEHVSVIEFEGRFRSKEVEVRIIGDQMTSQSFIPGHQEELLWRSWVVDSECRAMITTRDGREILSLG